MKLNDKNTISFAELLELCFDNNYTNRKFLEYLKNNREDITTLEDIFEAGYEVGRDEGYEEGHEAGYDEGYGDGHDAGYVEGYGLGS